jgi:hypothetical protein
VSYLIYNTVFLLQILASVEMRRFLSTSRLNDEREDAAAARRDRALHAWRNLGSPPTGTRVTGLRPKPPPTTNVLAANFLLPGVKADDLLLNAVSAAATAYSQAAPTASPTVTASPVPAAPATRPVPTFLAPLPPQGSFTPLHHSTPDPSLANWYKKAAAAREARRPVYRATAVSCGPPPADLAELAEKFRAAARGRTSDVQPPVSACSTDDSFATANLSNNSILESDFHDNSKILVPVSVAPTHPPPLPPLMQRYPGVWGIGPWIFWVL